MAELKGRQTEQNLQTAFACESQARNNYTYFASAARKEGYGQISAIFLETAELEKEHAKPHLKLLEGIVDNRHRLRTARPGTGTSGRPRPGGGRSSRPSPDRRSRPEPRRGP
jgi:rubrerythrin